MFKKLTKAWQFRPRKARGRNCQIKESSFHLKMKRPFLNGKAIVVALSALVLLLAGCGSADPAPAPSTTPPSESAAPQESEVVAEIPEPTAAAEEWMTITNPLGEFTLSIPASWSYYHEANNSWIDIDGEANGVELLFDADTMNLDPLEFEYAKEESMSWDYFEFDDGHLGYVFMWPDAIWWSNNVMPRHMHLTLYHGGDMSIFTDNEELILRVARSLTSALPSETADTQAPAQMVGTPVDADISHIENLFINREWTFEGPGGILGGAHYDTLGFPQNRFFFIDFFEGGIGELSDWPGEDIAKFDWALIDDAANERIVLNIFSVWIDPVAAHAGLWYEVSLSTLGVQQTITLQGFDTSFDTIVMTGW